MAAARGIVISSREVREVRKVYLLLLSLLGDLESWRFGGIFDFVAQQTMPRWARRLMGRRKHQGKRCDLHISTFLYFYTAKNKNDSPPFYTFLHVLHG